MKKSKEKKCSEEIWSYNNKDNNGPENWMKLCPEFAECGGKRQSPVNIITSEIISFAGIDKPDINYKRTKVKIVNNTHSIQFDVDTGNHITIDNKKYPLVQFHFHSLSEHTINGKHYPLEIHFVHIRSEFDIVVFAIMIEEGKDSPFFKKFFERFPREKGIYTSNDILNLPELLPENKSFYYYNGSLTTPPCSEVVKWYVFKNTIEASKEQIEEFSLLLNNNYRKVLPLNGRKIYSYDF